MVRYWVEVLAAVGPPTPGVVADGPYGLAFRDRLVAVNPTTKPRTVTFRSGDKVVTRIEVAPGATVTRRPSG
jgi:hypothetical protein